MHKKYQRKSALIHCLVLTLATISSSAHAAETPCESYKTEDQCLQSNEKTCLWIPAGCGGTGLVCDGVDTESLCISAGCTWNPQNGDENYPSCYGTPSKNVCNIIQDQGVCVGVNCVWTPLAHCVTNSNARVHSKNK